MKNAIELKHLRKEYPTFVLDDLTFSLPSGCILGFIGENGAGKTTTIKAMLGLIEKTSGEVLLLGKPPHEEKSVMEEVGLVLDTGFFPQEMNALSLGKALSYVYRNWDKEAYSSYLLRFQIEPKKKIKNFSRGMTMKLSLAVALSHKAKLLILDEATSGLDPVARDDLLDILFEFIQEEEHSVFLSSHITGDLEKIADYVAFLHQGKLVFFGEKDVLLDTCGILKCTAQELEAVDPQYILGLLRHKFGVTALVKKYYLPKEFTVEQATLEDIMLYSIKGDKFGKVAL